MATVVMHAVVSVDGYLADDNDDVGPLSSGTSTVTSTWSVAAHSKSRRHWPGTSGRCGRALVQW